MEDFLPKALLFIDRWSYVFYAVGLLGVLLYLGKAREAYRQRRFTPFPIEREEATAMLRDSLIILSILVAILATTFYIDTILLAAAETAEAEELLAVVEPTATPTSPAIGPSPTGAAEGSEVVDVALDTQPEDAQPEGEEGEEAEEAESEEVETALLAEENATPTHTPTVEVSPTPRPTSTPTIQPTATVEASPIPTQPPPTQPPPTEPPAPTDTPLPPPTEPPPPTNTPAPTSPPVPAASCPTPGVQITSPANGQLVSGSVAILGTANIERFQFYKVEYAVNGTTGPYASIGDVVRSPVTGGQLMTWNTSGFPSGIWNLRLTVVDETGNFPAPCNIYVMIP